MIAGPAALALILAFDPAHLVAYRDSRCTLAIGFGHHGAVYTGQRITQREAEILLRGDLRAAGAAVTRLVSAPLTQHQFDSLASFIYNVGAGSFARSNVRKRLNARDYAGAAEAILLWTRAGNRRGALRARRMAEYQLFTRRE